MYDGTNYELIGDINTDTNNKTKMTVTTSGTYPILGTYEANRTATATEGTRFASAIKIDPDTERFPVMETFLVLRDPVKVPPDNSNLFSTSVQVTGNDMIKYLFY